MSNEVEICNLALSHIGAYSIQALTDQTKEARECKRLWPTIRDSVLRDHDWSFARKRLTLALLDETYSGWAYTYQYPIDCLNPREIYNGIEYPAKPFQKVAFETGVNGNLDKRIILTNQSLAELIYTAKVINANLYDAIFIDAASWRLASDLVQPLKAKAALQQSTLRQYLTFMSNAQAENSSEGHIEPNNDNAFVRARS